MVRRPAVNRKVIGSNPIRAAKEIKVHKTIEKAYAYYISEYERYKVYENHWKWLWPKHYRWADVQRKKEEWRARLHTMEKCLDLSEKEKEKL